MEAGDVDKGANYSVILVTWRLADGSTGSAEFSDDRLEEINERCYRKFGSEKTEGAERELSEIAARGYQGRDMESALQAHAKANGGRGYGRR